MIEFIYFNNEIYKVQEIHGEKQFECYKIHKEVLKDDYPGYTILISKEQIDFIIECNLNQIKEKYPEIYL